MVEHIEQRIKSGRIFAPIEKKGFEWKKDVDHIQGSYTSNNSKTTTLHLFIPNH